MNCVAAFHLGSNKWTRRRRRRNGRSGEIKGMKMTKYEMRNRIGRIEEGVTKKERKNV